MANDGGASITESNDDLGCESDSDSSFMSDDLITRNADFVSLN